MSRLCFYFLLIIVSGVLLLPRHSTGVYKAEIPSGLDGLELAASYPIRPSGQLLVKSSVRDITPSEKVTSKRPAMRVKTGYYAIIQQAGQRHGVEAALIQAIIMAESSYNPHAVSHRGAAGLMQLMPATADSMGVKDRFDPEHNIDGGVRYFKRLLVRFDGDKRLALAAYNAGARKVRQYNGIPPYKTTRSYIARVFQYYQTYKDLATPSNKV
ncbi:MAG: lytic transglycosylase domain-containing protein [Desulfobacterales bacterium]|nr:lytic transglycosylase domain-containing protein [Desulfobacterales bacterium]